MTAYAGGLRRAEGATDVTAFAGHVRMRAIQFEASTEMIEGQLRPSADW